MDVSKEHNNPRATSFFYLAVAPRFFSRSSSNWAGGLTKEESNQWARVIVEKPFGHDLVRRFSSTKDLKQVLLKTDLSHRPLPRQETVQELNRRTEIVAEGLFHDHAGPLIAFFLGEPAWPKLLDDRREKARGDGKIKKLVALGIVLLADVIDLLRQALVGFGVLEIALYVVKCAL